jgi:uncharacterized membrane protein
MPVCGACGSDVGEGVKFCPKCGQPQAVAAASPAGGGEGYSGGGGGYSAGAGAYAAAAPTSASTGANDNVLGAVAYITIIPAILFLVLEPYNKNRFIRFHSFQCLFLALSAFVLSMANMILSMVMGFVPVVGWIIGLLLGFGIPIALFVVWLLAVIKAYQGQQYRLPIIGDLAAKQA